MQPLVVRQVCERTACNYCRVANVTVDCLIVEINRGLNLVCHEIREKRVRVFGLSPDFKVQPSRKIFECIVVACISSIELVSIKEDAGQCDGSLDVPLEVFGVVYEVEGVAGVFAQIF